MEQDLKKENNTNLFLILAASLLCSALIQIDISSVIRIGELAALGSSGLMLSAVLVMLTNLLPHDVKHKFVFLRYKNEMPACRVHKLCIKEPRIEYEDLRSRWPDIFDDGIDEQTRNSRWYQKIYKNVKDFPEVRQGHRNFLLYRDAFSGLLIITLAALLVFFAGELPVIGQLKPSVIYVQIIFCATALIAANTAGKRLVVNSVVVA